MRTRTSGSGLSAGVGSAASTTSTASSTGTRWTRLTPSGTRRGRISRACWGCKESRAWHPLAPSWVPLPSRGQDKRYRRNVVASPVVFAASLGCACQTEYMFFVYGGYWVNFTHILVSGSHVLGVWMLLEKFCLAVYGHFFYEPRASGTLSVVCSWVAEWRSVLSRCLSCLAPVSNLFAEWRSVLFCCFSRTICSRCSHLKNLKLLLRARRIQQSLVSLFGALPRVAKGTLGRGVLPARGVVGMCVFTVDIHPNSATSLGGALVVQLGIHGQQQLHECLTVSSSHDSVRGLRWNKCFRQTETGSKTGTCALFSLAMAVKSARVVRVMQERTTTFGMGCSNSSHSRGAVR